MRPSGIVGKFRQLHAEKLLIMSVLYLIFAAT